MGPIEETNPGQLSRLRAQRAALPSLGFGFLFASYLSMIGRAGATPGEFFFSASLGILCTGLAVMATGSWFSCRSSKNYSAFALLACLVFGSGSAIAGGAFRCLSAAGLPDLEEIAGALFGAGCMLIALVWTKIYASYHFIDALRRGSAALLCGVLLHAISRLAPSETFEYGCGIIYLCIALACALFELLQHRTALFTERPPIGRLDLIARTGSIIRHTWAPLCGLGICSFLLGSLWMQAFPSPETQGIVAAAGMDSIGPALALSIICAATFRISQYDQASKLFWVVMPITAAIFLITPSLEEMPLPGWNLLVANLQNAGSACILLCTWALLLLGARTNGLSVYVVFGGALALIGGLSLWGAFSFDAFGLEGNVISVVLFILYMSAVILFLAWGGTEDRSTRRQASDFFNEFIRTRCAKLAEAHELTPRESELLTLLGRGHGYAYIAETLYISKATVRTHARNIYRKLGIGSQEELLALIDHTDRTID